MIFKHKNGKTRIVLYYCVNTSLPVITILYNTNLNHTDFRLLVLLNTNRNFEVYKYRVL